MELEDLSIVEKAAMLSGGSEWDSRGNDRADIPSFVMSDGPHGVRRQLGEGDHLGLGASKPATCFPTACTVANTWDPALAEEMGEALGKEAHDLDVNVLLGPGMNIKRNPLCGRNFEYYSEDPIVAGRMAAGLIRGIQSNGVSACPKHFAVNSQELRRQASNSVVDERTMRELYLTGFEIAVREAHPMTIMTSYNEVNGVYAHENKHLLQEILRDEWGFDGMVVSDWGGSNSAVAAVKAGGLRSCRSLTKLFDYEPNFGGGHFMGHHFGAEGARNGGWRPRSVCVDYADLATGVMELNDAQRAPLMKSVGVFFEAGNVLVFPESADILMTFAGDICYRKVLRDDHRKATFGLGFVVCGKPFGAASVLLAQVHYHCGNDAAVFELSVIYRDWAEQTV
mgnify:CR=1 FL=1